MKTEYQVRPVTRYVVTRYRTEEKGAASSVVGEFQSGDAADSVADAMVAKDKELGYQSTRTRHGLSMGEVISGKRLPQIEEPQHTIELKIPPAPVLGDAPDECLDDSWQDAYYASVRMRDEFIKALEAAGIKVKQ